VIVVNVRVPKRIRLRTVGVRATNATIRRNSRTQRRFVVDARGRPRVRVVVSITAIARDGTRYSERRAYRTCVRR
jgi:hypothetical protein